MKKLIFLSIILIAFASALPVGQWGQTYIGGGFGVGDSLYVTGFIRTDSLFADQASIGGTSIKSNGSIVMAANDTLTNNGNTITNHTVYLTDTNTIADTALYIKKYGAKTNGIGIAIDMDTSANTAANVKGIDMTGSNAINNGADYYLSLSPGDYWSGQGTLLISGQLGFSMFRGGPFVLEQYNSDNIQLDWSATKKGDIIFKDGNHATGTVNLNFLQGQDSSGVVQWAFPNRGNRGEGNFTATCLIDTVVVPGVSANSFIFPSFQGTVAPTSGLSWEILGVKDSIILTCLPADSSKLRSAGYQWFRLE